MVLNVDVEVKSGDLSMKDDVRLKNLNKSTQ